MPPPPPAVPGCDNSCAFAFDLICDEPPPALPPSPPPTWWSGVASLLVASPPPPVPPPPTSSFIPFAYSGRCAYGTDCADCSRPALPPPPSPPSTMQVMCTDDCPLWSDDGDCDDGGEGAEWAACTLASDCTDCGPRHFWLSDPPSPPPAAGTACSNECLWSGDGDCDDGGEGSEYAMCEESTDCIDCGVRTRPQLDVTSPSPPPYAPDAECSNECVWSGDGDCDDGGAGSEYMACHDGTDCADCGVRASSSPPPPYSPPLPPGILCQDTCIYARNGRCDDGGPSAATALCGFGTDCEDCRYLGLDPRPLNSANLLPLLLLVTR